MYLQTNMRQCVGRIVQKLYVKRRFYDELKWSITKKASEIKSFRKDRPLSNPVRKRQNFQALYINSLFVCVCVRGGSASFWPAAE